MVCVLYLILIIGVVFAVPADKKTRVNKYRPLKIKNKEDLVKKIQHIFMSEGIKGGTDLSKQLIRRRFKKGELLKHAFENLDRSAFVGIVPRCFCKYLTCNLPYCISYCSSDKIKGEEPLDCLSCLGECLPLFMRCVTGNEH